MAALDWTDAAKVNRVRVLMVDPRDVNRVLGELRGVDLSGSSLDAGYYSDTRTSGKLAVRDDGWIRGSLLRIVHEIPEWRYSNVLGTYIVTDDGARRDAGAWHYDMTLQSRLYGLSTDKLNAPWTIAANAYAETAMRQIVAGAEYYDLVGAPNVYRFKGAQVMDTGTSRLSALFALTNASRSRLDVTPNGDVLIEPYVEPRYRTPKLRIDLRSSKGVASGALTRTTNWLSMPDEVVVSYKWTETSSGGQGSSQTIQREVHGSATVWQLAHQHRSNRGYRVTDHIEVRDLQPPTALRAQQLAREYLERDSGESIEWELTTIYLPLWEGDVVELYVPDGQEGYTGLRKCLVKSVSLSLDGAMPMKLTLKETNNVEDEEAQ